ncbi:hypothetical protein MVG78_16785 [Roseomonas gilardii subsp. gilardii]|uniref:hypothetical protein n=1 Tax=Roseomonas gilardii TaxID=257708 RepID=UPI001FF7051D|nr:hypothetical protein [Roseomonas gilardii]UPG72158.1 hypothetical protein MVG78_16785 [Roseomonas gilardii subsp. gilardii]
MSDFPDSGRFDAEGIRAWMERRRAEREEEARRAEEEKQTGMSDLRRSFEERDLPPDALTKLQGMIRRAALDGEREALVLHFPSQWMKDSGRSITSGLETWPEQLTGFARRAYDFYEKELAPRGFGIRPVILDYPNGMPGDVGFYITWKTDLD